MAILSLGQEKAIDRVDWSFLLRTLLSMGFSPSLISWVKLLRELNTALLNFFWGGKKDLVAFDVVIHHREDSGFQLVSFPSLEKSMPSLHSGSSVYVFLLVSLLNFWCFNRFGVDPRVCFPHLYPCIPGFCRLSLLPCSILKFY